MAVWEGFTKKVAFESRPEGSEEESLEDIWEKCISPRSPALQADSLPAELQGKPKNTGAGSLPLF